MYGAGCTSGTRVPGGRLSMWVSASRCYSTVHIVTGLPVADTRVMISSRHAVNAARATSLAPYHGLKACAGVQPTTCSTAAAVHITLSSVPRRFSDSQQPAAQLQSTERTSMLTHAAWPRRCLRRVIFAAVALTCAHAGPNWCDDPAYSSDGCKTECMWTSCSHGHDHCRWDTKYRTYSSDGCMWGWNRCLCSGALLCP